MHTSVARPLFPRLGLRQWVARCRLGRLSRLAALGGVLAGVLSWAGTLHAQETGRVTARVRGGDEPVEGALVRSDRIGAVTNARGEATLVLPIGPHAIVVARIGFVPDTVRLLVRAGLDTVLAVRLRERAVVVAPVVVTSARIERAIEDEPLRVEVLAGEEIDEKSQMRPADLTVLLREMSGVRVQATSPTLGGANVRIQGLRGQYTQTLSDGLPLYGAQPGGFGLLQIPPLDLAQAEVIKGAATALYGPSALGGVLNLVSRRPAEAPERAVVLNQTSRSGTDGALWLSRRLGDRWGYTMLGGAHRQGMVDVDGDGWADLPRFARAELRPRLFWTGGEGRSVFATAGVTAEDRVGGTAPGSTLPGGGRFAERLDTRRADAGVVARWRVGGPWSGAARGSLTERWQDRAFGGRRERSRAQSLFGELSLSGTHGGAAWVVGTAVQRDDYESRDLPEFDYTFATPSLFAQYTQTPVRWLALSASGRCDAHSEYGTACTPRVSALFRPARDWSLRLSGGGGFFAPTPFTEETEAVGLFELRPPEGLRAERARHASLDLTGKRGPLTVSGTLHATDIARAVALRAVSDPGGTDGATLELVNSAGPARTRGGELFAVLSLDPITVLADYAYLHATELSPEGGGRREVPLNPRHSGGLDVAWEEEESGSRVSLELFYTGRQALEDNPYQSVSRPYTTVGLLVTRRVGRAQLYLNGEDLTNVRQTRYHPLLLPSPGRGGRWTTDAWAPLEGRTVNGGVRLEF